MPSRPTCPREAPCGLCPGCVDDTLQRAASAEFAPVAPRLLRDSPLSVLPGGKPWSRPAPHTPGPHEIETASGQYVDVAAPHPATIALEDIAHALSRICRFTGHVSAEHYSVAEHAVLVMERVAGRGLGWRAALAALHHDDAEAYLGDVARPLKSLLPEYASLERRMQDTIVRALGLPDPFHLDLEHDIKAADEWALSGESWELMPSRGAAWFCDGMYDPQEAHHRPIGLLSWEAEALWLNAHYSLVELGAADPAA